VPKPIDQAEVTRCLEQLRLYAAQLPHVVDSTLPVGFVFVQGEDEGLAIGNTLKATRDSIDNILWAFDEFQKSIGEKRPRHEDFLKGKSAN
jgi:hypothetical protein